MLVAVIFTNNLILDLLYKPGDLNQSKASMSSFATNSKKLLNSKIENFLYVPCTNCGDWVHVERIEDHSNSCVMVKADIVTLASSSSLKSPINYKLKKLLDHLNNLRQSPSKLNVDYVGDMHYIISLIQYISDTLNILTITSRSLTDMKKTLMNIDV